MYQLCKLVLSSYMPKQLEKGMLFLTEVGKELSLFELDYVPADIEKFVQYNGYPREPHLVALSNPNLNRDFVIATPEQIGWWDEGPHCDEYRDITVRDMNEIINNHEGHVLLEVEEDYDNEDKPIPIIYDGGKIAMRFNFDEEEAQEYFFNGDEDWNETDFNNEND